MALFHLTPDGPKPCAVDTSKPNSRGCQYDEHYTNSETAWSRFEEFMEETRPALAGLKSDSRRAELKAGAESAMVSRAYGHWSVANDHLHNASDVGSAQELFYYASPQGRLELKRRILSGDSRYKLMEEALEDFRPEDFDGSVNEETLAKHLERAQDLIPREDSFVESKSQLPKKDPALRHYLIEQSHAWLSRLTPEEQEALSHTTSNGYEVLQFAKGYPSEGNARDFFKYQIDEDAIYDRHGLDFKAAEAEVEKRKLELAQERLKLVLSTFERAPRLKEPFVIARGTTPAELADILGADPKSNKAELMDELESGRLKGAPISESSRINNIPQSASIHGSVARSFSGESWDDESTEERRVIVTVRARTMASPANVSAWGTAELEVYTNPSASYRILGGRRVGENLFVLELEED